jgi:radical SAM protein with 4Fe4S-binding SPASM domain
MIQYLAAAGIRHIFGYPGDPSVEFLEAARREGMSFVLGSREGTAGLMAEAYGQLTGRPGVCLSTLGPGSTNLVNAVANAYLDRVPMLAISGQIENNPTWVPSDKDYQAIFKRLLVARAKNRKIEVSLNAFLHCYPMQESVLLAKKGIVSCKAGISRLSIGSDGSIYPCNFVISDNRWNMGNIKNEPLADIWFSDKWRFFRGQTKLNTLSKCKDCKSLKHCNDFYCRLLPYTVYGDELSPPPKCNIDR